MSDDARAEVHLHTLEEMREGDIFLRALPDGVLVSRKKDSLPAYEPSDEIVQVGIEALRSLGSDVGAREIVTVVLQAAVPHVLRAVLPAYRAKLLPGALREAINWMADVKYLNPQTRYSALRHYHLVNGEEQPRLRAVD